jgi:type I restriction enzyme S subunit
MSFPLYESYKDSGVEWLGEVPSHWAVKPIKAVSSLNDDALDEATPDEYEIEYVEISGVESSCGIRETTVVRFGEAPSRARRCVRDGDVIVSTVRTYLRAIAPVVGPPDNLVVSTGFAVIRPHSIHPRFIAYALQAEFVIAEIIARSVGVSYPAINASDLVRIEIPIPQPVEQSAIADFLDHETAKIDAMVNQQRRLVELLKNKRQAVISHAVTKGLDTNVSMKDSGVESLGEVPERWAVGRLKHFAEVRGRIGFRGYTADDLVSEGEGALALGGANLSHNGRISLELRTFLSWPKYEESPEIKVNMGDILIGQRGTCGRVSHVDTDLGPATINPSLVVLKNVQLDPCFLTFWLMSDFVQKTFESYLNKTAVPMLSQEQIGGMPTIAPPPEEQSAIATYLTEATAKLDRLLAEAENATVLLQERRSALISAAVTGKIDVCGLMPIEAEAA